MGTNYYVDLEVCPTCKRPKETVHIGKSSYGWKFHFQGGTEYFNNVKELRKFLKGKEIYDEYGRKISYEKFWEMVEEKQKMEEPDDIYYRTDEDGYKFFDKDFS